MNIISSQKLLLFRLMWNSKRRNTLESNLSSIRKVVGTIVHITYQKTRKKSFKDKCITRVLIGFHDHIKAYSCYILKHKNDHIQVHESI